MWHQHDAETCEKFSRAAEFECVSDTVIEVNYANQIALAMLRGTSYVQDIFTFLHVAIVTILHRATLPQYHLIL